MKKTVTLKVVDGKQFVTVEEAGQVLGIKPTVVRNYLSAGKMTTYKFKSLTLLKAQEVEIWSKKQKERR